jgi:hypothetical protein
VDDLRLTTCLAKGESEGLLGAFDAYGDRLYAYCLALLADEDLAAAVTRDTLLVAGEAAASLRQPDLLRPWLYALARNECLRSWGGPLISPQRELAELSDQHRFEAADVGAVLGIPTDHVTARLAELSELAETMPRLPSAVVPAGLRDELAAASGAAGADRRRALARRARPFDEDGFPVPLDRRRLSGRVLAWSTAVVVLLAITLLVLLPAGRESSSTALAASVPGQAADAPGLATSGAPLTGDVAPPPSPIDWPGGSATSVGRGDSTGPDGDAASRGSARPSPTSQPRSTSVSSVPSPTPGLTTGPPAGREPGPTATVAAWYRHRTANCPSTWSAQVYARAFGIEDGDIRSMVARWWDLNGDSSSGGSVTLRRDNVWTADLTGLPVDRSLAFEVRLTTKAGDTASSGSRSMSYSCG